LGYTIVLLLASWPNGTRMLITIFIRLLCLLHQQGRFIYQYSPFVVFIKFINVLILLHSAILLGF